MKKILWTLILTGCAVGPNYEPPVNDVAENWATEVENIEVSHEAPLVEWWQVFDDPLLTKYMEKASECNNDVLTAESNILQARALRQVAASSFYPQIGADVNATKTYFSKNGPVFAIGPAIGSLPGAVSTSGLPFEVQVPQIQPLYNALFDATWEIDLFGKTRRTVEAADAVIGSTIEQRNDILISVMAEVALNYMEVRSLQKQKELLEENVAILEKERAIIVKQYEAGYVSLIDYETIEAQLAAEQALIPDTKAQIYRGIYMLSILTGAPPEALVDEMIEPRPLPSVPETIIVGLRSDLLRRRPDVRRAERNLAAATAYIGVAVAQFFPTIQLFGDGGFQSLMIKNLFQMASKTWALGGDINMPIFQGGRLMGNLKAARAQGAAAAHIYQQTVLTALEEAEGSLMSYSQDLATVKDRNKETESYRTLVALSNERFSRGLVSMLNLLNAEQQLNQAEQTLLASQTDSLLDLVTLYKALGGGWEIRDPDYVATPCNE